jgi:hypothetical protein
MELGKKMATLNGHLPKPRIQNSQDTMGQTNGIRNQELGEVLVRILL